MSAPPTASLPAPPSAAADAAADAGAAPPVAGAGHELSSRIQGLICPNCGGELEVDAGLRVVVCAYCETPLLAQSEIGVRRFAVEPKIGAEEAREAARRWLSTGWSKHRRLKRDARIGEAFLSFLPFYRVEADCVGIALGTERRTRTVGSGNRRRVETYEVDVERTVEKSYDRTYPALNVAEWGIRRVDLKGDRLVPFDPRRLEREGMIFPPTGSETAVKVAAIAEFKRHADPAAGLHRVRFRFLATLRERLSVVYYPLWLVRYAFQDRSYQVLVDAEAGAIAYGKAPGNDVFRAVMLVLSQAATLYVGTTILQLAGDVRVAFLVGIPLLVVLGWGWKKFRYGGVVIEGTGTESSGLAAVAVEALESHRLPRLRDLVQ